MSECHFCPQPAERIIASNQNGAVIRDGFPISVALFETTGTESPKLKEPVYFWIKAWRRSTVGIWGDFGPTRLTFLEYLLIGVASAVFPDTLLNREGRNRM